MDTTDNVYFQAVIDTSQLISVWLKQNSGDIRQILSSLEINLESKHGPFTNKLSNQFDMNETLGLKAPDSYWKGVQDTLSLIKNFFSWKQASHSSRSIENFLLEITNKSNIRLEPEQSPLVSTLGISFEQEFSDRPIPSFKSSLSKGSFESIIPESHSSPVVRSFLSTAEEIPVTEPTSDETNNSPNSDKAFDPKEFIDDEKFLDQLITDSTTPEPQNKPSNETTDSERDYLRSALAELSVSHDDVDSEPNRQIEIQFKGDNMESSSPNSPDIPAISTIEEDLEENDSSRLLSSSLRDALRMLREEE